jgi:hypothetical protein
MASNDCIMNCGNPVAYVSHGVCKNCYSSIRIWQKKKTPDERAARIISLNLYRQRINAVETAKVVIGDAHYMKRGRGKRYGRRQTKRTRYAGHAPNFH